MTPCRLCSRISDVNVDIFDDSFKIHDLQLKINQLFSLWIDKKDSFALICTECMFRVLDFYSFSERVKETQLILLQGKFINKVPTEDTKDENQEDSKNVDELQHETILEKGIPNNTKTELIDHKEIKIEFIDSASAENIEEHHVDSDLFSLDCADVNIDTQDQKREKKETVLKELPQKHIAFPAELIRNGKIIIKRPKSNELINNFYSLNCLLCTDHPIFYDYEMLMKHISSVHKTKGYITCCNIRLFKHRSIYFHMAKHLQPSAFECPICKKQFSRPLILKMHIENHLNIPEKLYKCDRCDKSFVHEKNLKRHQMSFHVPDDEKKNYNCNDCGKEYISTFLLTMHIKNVHQSVKSFLCAVCGKSFLCKSTLNAHMFTHDLTGKNIVRCKQCNLVFKHAQTLKNHLKRHSDKKFDCSDCSYSTYNEPYLNEHIKLKHTNEKPHVCSFCKKSFKRKSNLNDHLPQHTGEIKFTCKFCPRTFLSSGNGYSHQKKMHAEEHKKHLDKQQSKKIKDCEIKAIVQETSTNDAYEAARKLLNQMSNSK